MQVNYRLGNLEVIPCRGRLIYAELNMTIYCSQVDTVMIEPKKRHSDVTSLNLMFVKTIKHEASLIDFNSEGQVVW